MQDQIEFSRKKYNQYKVRNLSWWNSNIQIFTDPKSKKIFIDIESFNPNYESKNY